MGVSHTGYRDPSEATVNERVTKLAAAAQRFVCEDHGHVTDNARDDLAVVYLERAAQSLRDAREDRRRANGWPRRGHGASHRGGK